MLRSQLLRQVECQFTLCASKDTLVSDLKISLISFCLVTSAGALVRGRVTSQRRKSGDG